MHNHPNHFQSKKYSSPLKVFRAFKPRHLALPLLIVLAGVSAISCSEKKSEKVLEGPSIAEQNAGELPVLNQNLMYQTNRADAGETGIPWGQNTPTGHTAFRETVNESEETAAAIASATAAPAL